MKRKTYNNVLKATRMIMKKGYELEEAAEIARNIFDQHENGPMPIESYLNQIATKEEWLEGHREYMARFQQKQPEYPAGC